MLRIATRRSALAVAQATQTAQLITQRTGQQVELVPMSSTGDDNPDARIDTLVAGGDVKGLFVDSIRRAVLDKDCHLAVHSYKDVPTEPHPELTVAAVPGREDPRDLLVSPKGWTFGNLPASAIVGTSSARRKMQLLRAKPGLQVLPIRGNLDTRLRKLVDGEFEAIVVALAGLKRLYTSPERGGIGALQLPLAAVPLEPGEMVPAPAQGAIAIECRADDARTVSLLEAVDHLPSHRAVSAERAYLNALGAGCTTPAGALCSLTGMGGLEVIGMLGDERNRRVLRRSTSGGFDQAEEIGRRLAGEMLEMMPA